MSTLVVSRIGDGINSAPTEKIVLGNTHAYGVFAITGGIPSVLSGSYNIGSVTDGGVGEPWMNLSTYLTGVNAGASFISPSVYSTGVEYAAQAGSQIVLSSRVECYCGSDTNTRNDWLLGNFTLVGKSV